MTAPPGEFSLIEKMVEQLGDTARSPRLLRGIGDDCAVVEIDAQRVQLVTTDLLVESVHFDRRTTSAAQLGHKALAVNLSDIAAMGGIAREAYVSLAITGGDTSWVGDLYAAMADLAREFGVTVAGGDVTRSPGPLFISITIVGESEPEQVVTRAGAKASDVLFVSGPLGDSRAGLEALQNALAHSVTQNPTDATEQVLASRHLLPQPELALGRRIAQSGLANAMMDISDGLLGDLRHICEQSGVGAVVIAPELPLSPELRAYCARDERDAAEYALRGGEDYCLLVAGEAELANAFDELTPIGFVRSEQGIDVQDADGRIIPIPARGYDHFA
jgi:thiamine-monophosphate kinase